jgi:hypothetical protein
MSKMASKGGLSRAVKTGASSGRATSDPAAPIQAMQLLGRWTRMAQGQIGYGGGCACCTGFDNVQVKDMEQHILDYLDSKYRAAGAQALCALIAQRAGYRQAESGSISELLRAIAMQSDKSVAAEEQLSLLADLGRSIDSLDELMRSG